MTAPWFLLLYPSMSDFSPALLPMGNFGSPNEATGDFQRSVSKASHRVSEVQRFTQSNWKAVIFWTEEVFELLEMLSFLQHAWKDVILSPFYS